MIGTALSVNALHFGSGIPGNDAAHRRARSGMIAARLWNAPINLLCACESPPRWAIPIADCDRLLAEVRRHRVCRRFV